MGSYLTAAEDATGINFDCIETFIDATTTWSQWTTPWIDNPSYGYTSWVSEDPTHHQLIVSTDLIPSEPTSTITDPPSNPLAWETLCDAGDFDSDATALASNLVAAGFGDSVIRLGMEMNGPWENDYMGYTTTEEADWATCFQKEVQSMRSVSGADFLFTWNPNSCVDGVPFADYYPGNAYVDIIGIDQYDAFCDPPSPAPSPSAATFASLLAESYGVNAIESFAVANGKPLAFPEWGTVEAPSDGGSGLGDDPYYVEGMASYVATHDVAYQSYFDCGCDTILPLTSADPLTLGAYTAAFG